MNFLSKHIHKNISRTGLEIFKYIGPGFLVTIGFIDPGNWAANIACGSQFGYSLLWVVTLSTVMLTFLQHNAAHLGIATGLCLSEASTKYFKKPISRCFLITGLLASISTITAQVLGTSIGLNMLFGIPLLFGAIITIIAVIVFIFTNSYRSIEKHIISFVSIIGLGFLYELTLSDVQWNTALCNIVLPSMPIGSIVIIMSVLGAVVMPHNIFLHSEVIQSRQWQLKNKSIIKKQLKFEFTDTIIAMIVGWAINCAIIILAAATFFSNNIKVTELSQAEATLRPLLGNSAATIFAVTLIFAGFSAAITVSMASGSIFAGMYNEPLDIKDNHSRIGILIGLLGAFVSVLFINDLFIGIIYSQTILSIQLPLTIFALIFLTSSKKVMGEYKNTVLNKTLLWSIALIVVIFNFILFFQFIFN
ncbi:MAG: Nramp family divalent metal transporter [Bacteroidota bacterium]